MEKQLKYSLTNQTEIDNLTDRLSKLILSDKSLLFQKRQYKPHTAKYSSNPKLPNHNPWFNSTCRDAKKKYYKAKTKYRDHKCDSNLNDLKLRSKEYKRTVKNQFNAYNKSISKKLRNLKSNNVKEYWNIINKINHKKT